MDTLTFIWAMVGITVLFDVWTFVAHGYEKTISWVLFTEARYRPILAVALGIVIGHIFWANGCVCTVPGK